MATASRTIPPTSPAKASRPGMAKAAAKVKSVMALRRASDSSIQHLASSIQMRRASDSSIVASSSSDLFRTDSDISLPGRRLIHSLARNRLSRSESQFAAAVTAAEEGEVEEAGPRERKSEPTSLTRRRSFSEATHAVAAATKEVMLVQKSTDVFQAVGCAHQVRKRFQQATLKLVKTGHRALDFNDVLNEVDSLEKEKDVHLDELRQQIKSMNILLIENHTLGYRLKDVERVLAELEEKINSGVDPHAISKKVRNAQRFVEHITHYQDSLLHSVLSFVPAPEESLNDLHLESTTEGTSESSFSRRSISDIALDDRERLEQLLLSDGFSDKDTLDALRVELRKALGMAPGENSNLLERVREAFIDSTWRKHVAGKMVENMTADLSKAGGAVKRLAEDVGNTLMSEFPDFQPETEENEPEEESTTASRSKFFHASFAEENNGDASPKSSGSVKLLTVSRAGPGALEARAEARRASHYDPSEDNSPRTLRKQYMLSSEEEDKEKNQRALDALAEARKDPKRIRATPSAAPSQPSSPRPLGQELPEAEPAELAQFKADRRRWRPPALQESAKQVLMSSESSEQPPRSQAQGQETGDSQPSSPRSRSSQSPSHSRRARQLGPGRANSRKAKAAAAAAEAPDTAGEQPTADNAGEGTTETKAIVEVHNQREGRQRALQRPPPIAVLKQSADSEAVVDLGPGQQTCVQEAPTAPVLSPRSGRITGGAYSPSLRDLRRLSDLERLDWHAPIQTRARRHQPRKLEPLSPACPSNAIAAQIDADAKPIGAASLLKEAHPGSHAGLGLSAQGPREPTDSLLKRWEDLRALRQRGCGRSKAWLRQLPGLASPTRPLNPSIAPSSHSSSTSSLGLSTILPNSSFGGESVAACSRLPLLIIAEEQVAPLPARGERGKVRRGPAADLFLGQWNMGSVLETLRSFS